MAEADDAGGDEKVKAAADGLKKMLEVLAPEPAAVEQKSGSPVVSVGHAACLRPGRGGQWPPRSRRQRAMRLSVLRKP